MISQMIECPVGIRYLGNGYGIPADDWESIFSPEHIFPPFSDFRILCRLSDPNLPLGDNIETFQLFCRHFKDHGDPLGHHLCLHLLSSSECCGSRGQRVAKIFAHDANTIDARLSHFAFAETVKIYYNSYTVLLINVLYIVLPHRVGSKTQDSMIPMTNPFVKVSRRRSIFSPLRDGPSIFKSAPIEAICEFGEMKSKVWVYLRFRIIREE
jgi:hypothetical protein